MEAWRAQTGATARTTRSGGKSSRRRSNAENTAVMETWVNVFWVIASIGEILSSQCLPKMKKAACCPGDGFKNQNRRASGEPAVCLSLVWVFYCRVSNPTG